jgi:hypothetical protein
MLRSTIIAGVLCGVLAVSLIGRDANAQASAAAAEQSIGKESLETSVNYEIEDGKVILNFELINHYTKTKKLRFSSGQQFEIVITDENGEEVYRYSDGKFFTLALVYKDIKPGQSIKWQDIWDMANKEGEILTSGKYKAEINILAETEEKEGKIDKSQLTAVIDFNLLETAARQFMPEGARFTAPLGPEGNNNFMQTELNNDAIQEIAVFYKDNNNAGVLLLEQSENEWELKNQIECSADSLEYADFLDMDGDKKP